ncbi:MAG: hypothetical protein SGCHY_000204 [Lobulomycetales sp.]
MPNQVNKSGRIGRDALARRVRRASKAGAGRLTGQMVLASRASAVSQENTTVVKGLTSGKGKGDEFVIHTPVLDALDSVAGVKRTKRSLMPKAYRLARVGKNNALIARKALTKRATKRLIRRLHLDAKRERSKLGLSEDVEMEGDVPEAVEAEPVPEPERMPVITTLGGTTIGAPVA